ncbi:hypothetical protein Vretifemale_15224 [Volvox reticuliferus]|nr:hypothetical protein Vretifemale_15224 [Volvox reticuliferus]
MLKCLAQLGALTAGFAVSAFYDFQYTASSDNPVLPFFGLATALTVGFELNSCVLCTLLLSSVVRIGKSYITEEEEAEYLWRLRCWTACHRETEVRPSIATAPPPPPAPRRDFQRHWDSRCESLWRTALALFLSGIPTFFAVMGLAGYLKFLSSPSTVIITAVLMSVAFVYTVVLSADWAKALLVGRSASSAPLDWQVGGWWRSSEPAVSIPTAAPSPFGFHYPPDKDSMWPPSADPQWPYGRTIEQLPYPAIIGLQPWPGSGPTLARRMSATADAGQDLTAGATSPRQGAVTMSRPEAATAAANESRQGALEPGHGHGDAGGSSGAGDPYYAPIPRQDNSD